MEPVKPAAVAPGRWDVRESGPLDAEHTVLLLPGGMCTTVAMEPIMDALAPAAIRVVAATLPGFGRTWHPDDLSVENYAALAGKLAADIGADVVAGHSLGANVARDGGGGRFVRAGRAALAKLLARGRGQGTRDDEQRRTRPGHRVAGVDRDVE